MADLLLLDPDLGPALRRAGFETAEALFALGGSLAETSVVREVTIEDVGRFHLKRYHYPGWRKSKGLLGRGTLWGTAPAVSEYRALARLRALGIPAARPVAAASYSQAGRLVTHALLTEHVPGSRDLATALRDAADRTVGDPAFRQRTLLALARLVRRMHDAAFVHRDLRPRNVLLSEVDGEPRLHLIDCRRGGPPSGRHSTFDDLATLDLDAESLATRAERRRFLRTYGGDPVVAREVSRRRERHREAMIRKGRRVR